jgi:methyl-accepting chemotaxis protein
MRQESSQAAKALAEQARAIGETAAATTNTSRQIKQITRANREHSGVAELLLGQVSDVRRIADRNAAGVKETRGTTSRLRDQAKALTSIVEGRKAPAARRASGNGAR